MNHIALENTSQRLLVDEEWPDSSSDIAKLLAPASIAIVGASQDTDKFGGRLIEVLQLHGYAGQIYPINPRRSEIFGLKAYSRLTDVPHNVDAAVLCVPQHKVLEALQQCAQKQVGLCIVISAKFAETGADGQVLENQLLEIARSHTMRLLGPNCLGFISRPRSIVLIPSPALYTHVPMPPGGIGVVSQSGAIIATLLDIAAGLGLGFSHAISLGNQLDLNAADFVRFLADDSETRVICCYLEGTTDFTRLLSSIRYARTKSKSVVILKAGRTSQGGKAAFTHTASLTTDYDAFATYAEAAGAILVDDPKTLLLVSGLLEAYPNLGIDDVVMVTNSGGGAAIVADRLSDVGVSLRELHSSVVEELGQSYFASHARNPLDWGGTDLPSEDELLERSFTALAKEQGCPLLLIVFLTNPNMRRTAEILARHVHKSNLPPLFLVLPDKAADVSRDVFRNEGLLFGDGVDEIVDAIAALHKARRRESLPRPSYRPSDTPSVPPPIGMGDLDPESLQRLLKQYGIMSAAAQIAHNLDEAGRLAAGIGYPVAVKLVSSIISHKSDVGGVEIGIADDRALRAAWKRIEAALRKVDPNAVMEGILIQQMIAGDVECLVGAKNAPGVGPVVVFGAGGTLAELIDDTAVLPVPCTSEQVVHRLSDLKVTKLLSGYRGKLRANTKALADIIVRLSWIAHDYRNQLVELDFNPVIVGAADAVVVDARARFKVPQDL